MRKCLLIALTAIAVGILVLGIISSNVGAKRQVFVKGSEDELELAKRVSLEILRSHALLEHGLTNVDEFEISKAEIDDLKMAHVRFQQKVNGLPVWEGEAIVHLRSDAELSVITDDLKANITVETKPNLSAEDAVEIAKRHYRGSKFLTEEPKVDLWIYRGTERDHLAYRVRMRRIDGSSHPTMPVIFIDAHTGEKIFSYDNLQTGSGSSLYSGTVTIDTSVSGSTYYMEDLNRRIGTFDFRNGTSQVYRFTDTDDIWNTSSQRAGVDAHYGAMKTYDYYFNVHGRRGVDNNQGPGSYTAAANSSIRLLSSRVHYGTNYNNAFWDGTYMTYGDGDGTTFTPLTTLDICGHEMTHGVIERTANLTYSGESGALNESFADVFGAMVELYARGGSPTADTWKIGEQAYTPNTAGDALRYMDDPHRAANSGFTADDDPDHYAERYTGTADNGGVHINSGIGNKAFYLVAAGGTHHRSGVTVTGIGATKAARIWYRALAYYMTSGTNFSGARTATLNAATDLYGSSSAEYNTVATAWCAVGVGSCPSGGTPTPTPTPSPGGSELIVNGGFEGSLSPWVSSGSGAFYTSNGSYPQSGTGYIYFGVNNSVTGQIYQQVSIPSSASGTLTFWLNVTSQETTTTTAYDRLFVEVRNTSGALLATLATYSNLDKVNTSAYSQKTLNVSAYRGQTVRIQFRVSNDSSLPTTFRVDTVSLR
ncbi:MAG: M4 family metallopeptidase [Pyrinomonadaceae bacterium]|nr:M4 family metallopeptidase [Pyrinomonadaceae bacterium]MCX7639198.1 M4 family metallopeptidase [Pyrinomonadaceae bacterium]MDW8303580.1 M4 family metallopeptidase [Acidobacteriota bacterium]